RLAATRAKRRRAIRLLQDRQVTDDAERRTPAQVRAIETLRAHQSEMAVSELIETAHISESVVATLIKKGIAEHFEQDVRRDPLAHAELPDSEHYELTEAQRTALTSIERSLKARSFVPFLLHGITGSGKTDVYIRTMHHALAEGRGNMMGAADIPPP